MSTFTTPCVNGQSEHTTTLADVFAGTTPEQLAVLEQDMATCIAEGVSPEEYLECLAEFDTAAEYIAQLEHGPQDHGQDTSPQETVEQDAPTHTVAEYRKRLADWGKLCASAAEQNFQAAAMALDTVLCYQGTHPGKAQRSTAIGEMASLALENDDDALYPPAGVDVVKFRLESANRERKRICQLVQGGALCAILFGTTPDMPVVGADGKARKSGARSGKGKGAAMPWRRVRELFPLVYRPNTGDEFHERWTLLPHAEEAARALVVDMVSGLKAGDVVTRVRTLCLESAQKRLEAGDRSAVEDVEFWGGKLEPRAARQRTEASGEENSVEPVDVESPVEGPVEGAERPATATEGPKNLVPTNAKPVPLSEQGKAGTVKDVAASMVELLSGKAEQGKADETFTAFLEAVLGAGLLTSRCHTAAMAAHKVCAK